jgi:hypothetical protein
MQILLKVQRCEIEPPSRLVDGFPRQLEAIVLKCLALNPEHRYADGDRLADELHDFLVSHQGAVHPRAKLAQRVGEYVRSHPLPVLQTPLPEPSPHPCVIDKTQASVRNDSTRLVASVGGKSSSVKSFRRPVLWLAAGLCLCFCLAGAGLWLAGRKGTKLSAVPVNPIAANLPVRTEPAKNAEPPSAKPEPAPAAITAESHPPVAEAPRKTSLPERKIHSLRAAVVPPLSQSTKANVEAPPASSPVEGGFLSLNATPWARVYIDGVSVAESTPLLKYALAAGNHVVVLVNPELKIRKEIQLSVFPGEHLRRKINLE